MCRRYGPNGCRIHTGFWSLQKIMIESWNRQAQLVNNRPVWLEGLRVHPAYEGKGIASQMHHFLINYWEQNCGGIVRLATISARTQVHHLCQKTGFNKIDEFFFYSWIWPMTSRRTVQKYFFGCETRRSSGSTWIYPTEWNVSYLRLVLDFGWKWAVPDHSLIKEAVANHSIYWHHDHSAIIFCTEISDIQDKLLSTSVQFPVN